jgi:primary-amine oxidase
MFKGERIAYEVSMNDISLIYSANDPVGGNVNFLDATFGNGEYRELMRGVDCPDYATYLTNFWWAAPGGAQTAMRSTCVFESTTGGTLWRRGGSFVSGLPDTELNVRFVMPNG